MAVLLALPPPLAAARLPVLPPPVAPGPEVVFVGGGVGSCWVVVALGTPPPDPAPALARNLAFSRAVSSAGLFASAVLTMVVGESTHAVVGSGRHRENSEAYCVWLQGPNTSKSC